MGLLTFFPSSDHSTRSSNQRQNYNYKHHRSNKQPSPAASTAASVTSSSSKQKKNTSTSTMITSSSSLSSSKRYTIPKVPKQQPMPPQNHKRRNVPAEKDQIITNLTIKDQLLKKQQQQQQQPSSWDQFKNLLTCKQIEGSRVYDPSKQQPPAAGSSSARFYPSVNNTSSSNSFSTKLNSCGSMCSFRDVVHGNTRVVHRSTDNSPESSSLGQDTRHLLNLARRAGKSSSQGGSTSSRSLGGGDRSHHSSSSGVGRSAAVTPSSSGARCRGNNNNNSSSNSHRAPLRKLSASCYECHMIVDPSRYPIIPRSTVSACPQCGEIFPKVDSLEHHQAVKHAVSELGPEDSGRNIVEIIFKSSWLKKDCPIYKIERILKVHNTQRTVQRFEDCRDAVKARATANGARKNPRCAADGNELLRFHCTSLSCALGARGSSSLCGSVPGCGVCTIIRNGFQGSKGVTTTASSGRAHDSLDINCKDNNRRAMLVCRVIAGRVKRPAGEAPVAAEADEEAEGGLSSAAGYDSVAGSVGIYSDLEELMVFNPKAILPCFVVIYKTVDNNNNVGY